MWLVILIVSAFLGSFVFFALRSRYSDEDNDANDIVASSLSNFEMNQEDFEKKKLPDPQTSSEVSVEETIVNRRSQRDFASKPLSIEQISQILWAAQGITDEAEGYRAAPSAGALYPLEIYAAVKEDGVENLKAGIYHYLPENHSLEVLSWEDLAGGLAEASLGQSFIADAPVSLVITADYSRTTQKYGERGRRYVYMEAGHAAENIYLQAEALDLGTVTVGAFHEEEIKDLLQIPAEYEPLYVMPVGYSE